MSNSITYVLRGNGRECRVTVKQYHPPLADYCFWYAHNISEGGVTRTLPFVGWSFHDGPREVALGAAAREGIAGVEVAGVEAES